MRKWKDNCPYSGQTSQIHRLSSACDPMLCSHHLEILHFWTRCPAISFCTGPHKLCSPDNAVGKESTCNVGGLGSIPRLGRFPGEGEGYPLQHSGLENSMDCRVHGVANSQTWLSNWTTIWKTAWGFLKKLNRTKYDPTIPVLSIYPKKPQKH